MHSWLGVLVLPWLLVIGFTGFYLNHADLVLDVIGQRPFSEAGFDAVKPPRPITIDDAKKLSKRIWPDEPVKKVEVDTYHGRRSYIMEKRSGLIILSIPTGHYYVKDGWTRRTYAPDGRLLHTKVYWDGIFEELHETGWLGGGMGTWFADMVALAMMFFGLTGLILWATPRLRRLRRRLSGLQPGQRLRRMGSRGYS